MVEHLQCKTVTTLQTQVFTLSDRIRDLKSKAISEMTRHTNDISDRAEFRMRYNNAKALIVEGKKDNCDDSLCSLFEDIVEADVMKDTLNKKLAPLVSTNENNNGNNNSD